MKTNIILSAQQMTISEIDGVCRVDRAIEMFSDKDGVCLFFMGEGTRVNFAIRLKPANAVQVARCLFDHSVSAQSQGAA